MISYGPPPVDPSGDPMLVDEADIYDPVRDERPCDHERAHVEPAGSPSPSGRLSMVWVCDDCGAVSDAGSAHKDSVL